MNKKIIYAVISALGAFVFSLGIYAQAQFDASSNADTFVGDTKDIVENTTDTTTSDTIEDATKEDTTTKDTTTSLDSGATEDDPTQTTQTTTSDTDTTTTETKTDEPIRTDTTTSASFETNTTNLTDTVGAQAEELQTIRNNEDTWRIILEEKANKAAAEAEESVDTTDTTTEKNARTGADIATETAVKKAKLAERAREDTVLDSDGDGISDFDEINLYDTDPNNADSDGDGYMDGAEVAAGFDPKDSASSAIITYENPQKAGEVDAELLAFSRLEAAEVVKQVDGREEKVNGITFAGRALPNSFVTLYIFSIPTMVIVKTDAEGNWVYTLDKELEDGEHEIYSAVTDGAGRIIAKSSSIPFVKEAAAITVDENLLLAQTADAPGFFSGGYLFGAVVVGVALVGLAFVIVGFFSRGRKEKITAEESQTVESSYPPQE